MKLENYETYKGSISADTFTFPYNPRIFDDSVDKFIDQKDYAYAFSYFGVTNPIKSKRIIAINGHFSGTSKSTNYQSLVRNVNDNKIKKLFLSTDKFYIVFPQTVKKTNAGGRTNFIDYVASFISPFGVLFSSTQKSGDNTDADKNEGDATTIIEKISGSVTAASEVTIKDKDGNGIIFTPSATGTVNIYLIYLVDEGNDAYFTEYLYADISGTKQKLKVADNSKSMFISLDADESLATRFTGGTISNISSVVFSFRDAYSSD